MPNNNALCSWPPGAKFFMTKYVFNYLLCFTFIIAGIVINVERDDENENLVTRNEQSSGKIKQIE